MPMRAFGTERLWVRPLGTGDQALYCRLYTHHDVMKHVGQPLTYEAARAGFAHVCRSNEQGDFLHRCWVISERGTGLEAGIVAVTRHGEKAEFGMLLLPQWQAKGIGKEVVPLLMDYVFRTSEISEMFNCHRLENTGVVRVMQALQFEAMETTARGEGWGGWRRTRSQWSAARNRPHPDKPTTNSVA
ncbi:GNAT family N-acetyltransferase [Pseudoxanthomonas wuyuanensis]|nr:GNAT family N-acetyltransferase [Pseudoxanthomonas wuyuanensis]